MSGAGGAVALILAAGAAVRMGGADKVFASLSGRAVISYSLRLFSELPEVENVLVVAAAGSEGRITELAEAEGVRKLGGIVTGGRRRQDSARVGLSALADAGHGERVVLVHDAARPLADRDLVRRVLRAVAEADAVVPAVPVVDTIKRVNADGVVEATLDRNLLQSVQTPQGFILRYISELHERAAAEGYYATDDAALVERYGGRVITVAGGPTNMKITTPMDLVLAEAILTREERSGDKTRL